ncbi:MAG: hypothetical protein QOI42_1380 [Frankiaceae bacterium]|nr:hypothetical protein [Frankiaceae bacterium]
MTSMTDAPSGTQHSPALTVLIRMMVEGFGAGNPDVVDELVSPDAVEHQFGLEGSGADAVAHVKAAIVDVHRSIPDLTFTLEDSVESGDTVWARFRGTGTATGPFFGPPSGRRVELTVFDVVRVVEGRIVEHWGVPDRFALLAQTGVLERLAG